MKKLLMSLAFCMVTYASSPLAVKSPDQESSDSRIRSYHTEAEALLMIGAEQNLCKQLELCAAYINAPHTASSGVVKLHACILKQIWQSN